MQNCKLLGLTRFRLQTVSQTADTQTRAVSYTYDQSRNGGPSSGRLTGITDALNRTTSFTYHPNLSGRVIQQTFPNGRYIQFQYDANGNLTGVTPPQKPVHMFGFNALDLLDIYTPPLAPFTGNRITTYDYNLNRQLTRVTRPDGLQINYQYDPQIGWLTNVSLPLGEGIGYAYHNAGCGCSGAGKPSDITFNAVDYTSALHYAYDGSLVTGVTWSGPVAGSVGAGYDNFFRATSLSVNGADAVSFGYDTDRLLVQAGDLTLSRDAQNGRLTGTTLGNLSDTWTYTGFGEAQSYTATAGGNALYATAFTRDNAGRITTKTETLGGVTSVYGYSYDPDRGWLTDVSSNGIATAHYDYDDNGNRTHVLSTDREVSSLYDNQDRLLHSTINSQQSTFAYSANGELQSKSAGGSMTTYTYDVRGILRAAVLPDGTQIDYVIDATGRRIGKKTNGVLVQGWLYQDALKPIVELDGAGNVVSRFVYASKANVPEYMIKGGVTYRLITDQIGSVRLIVNTANGTIVQQLDYDEFGRVSADTNPGFQPFGFAGGLYDPDIKLVHFGARDYDADIGRWISKDPIGFSGGNNWYAYVGNDPINEIDVFGLKTYLITFAPNNVGIPHTAIYVSDNVGNTVYTFDPTGLHTFDSMPAFLDQRNPKQGVTVDLLDPNRIDDAQIRAYYQHARDASYMTGPDVCTTQAIKAIQQASNDDYIPTSGAGVPNKLRNDLISQDFINPQNAIRGYDNIRNTFRR